MAHRPTDARAFCLADPRLELVLRTLALTGSSLVLLLPGGRGSTELLGWTPLWLAGLPLVAWWSLHRFRLPAWPSTRAVTRAALPVSVPPARVAVQARRRRSRPARVPRAA